MTTPPSDHSPDDGLAVPEPDTVSDPQLSSGPGSRFRRSQIVRLIGVGLVSGFFAGFFGIGGGVIIVPALVVVLGMDHRRAVGTSLLAIVPAALVATVAYALQGSVPVVVGVLLAIGAVTGAQFGARLLAVMSRQVAQWVFVVFVVVMVVQLVLVVPDRGQTVALSLSSAIALVALGLLAGVLSTVLGIGGGGVVVPVLMLGFGAGDLTAKGASLIMMIPGVLSGLMANLRRGNADVRSGLVVGGAAVLTSPAGAWVAHAVPAQIGSILFAVFLAFVGITMAREALRADRPAAD